MKFLGLLLIAMALCVTAVHAQYALQYGASVAVSEDQAIIGQGRNLLLPGTVTVLASTEQGWHPVQQIDGTGESGSGFGRALAADESTLAISATRAGSVHIYARGVDRQWVLDQTISADAEGFGTSVTIDADHLVVGSRAGTAFAYHHTDGEWIASGTFAESDSPRRNRIWRSGARTR